MIALALQQILLGQVSSGAAAPAEMTSTLGKSSPTSILFFFLIVAVTLVITYFAAKKTRTR